MGLIPGQGTIDKIPHAATTSELTGPGPCVQLESLYTATKTQRAK